MLRRWDPVTVFFATEDNRLVRNDPKQQMLPRPGKPGAHLPGGTIGRRNWLDADIRDEPAELAADVVERGLLGDEQVLDPVLARDRFEDDTRSPR